MTNPMVSAEELTPYLNPVFERRVKSITAIDVRKMTSYTDIIVIVEGGSGRQVTSLAQHIIKALKKEKIKVLGMEGIKEGEWALLDYGHIIIHVFESKAKDFYDLEGLWSDAPRIDLSKLGPVNILMILDGWGINPEKSGNAFAQAKTPFLDTLLKTFPNSHLACSGKAVGLPHNTMGNSEVGHMNMGAGRKVFQDFVRINTAIEDKSFFKNPGLQEAMDSVKKKDKALHLLGLLSDGGVHSHISHLFALIDMAKQNNIKTLYIHPILDGRDTPPKSAVNYIRQLQSHLDQTGTGKIATITGRYWAMDRDTRWERVEKAYHLYTGSKGKNANDPVQAVKNAYDAGKTDEFMEPVCFKGHGDDDKGVIQDGDGLIFFNFRAGDHQGIH